MINLCVSLSHCLIKTFDMSYLQSCNGQSHAHNNYCVVINQLIDLWEAASNCLEKIKVKALMAFMLQRLCCFYDVYTHTVSTPTGHKVLLPRQHCAGYCWLFAT